MSIRSRARALQRGTGFSYQQALSRIRELGAGPSDLKRTTGWSLERCDEVLVSASVHAELRRLAPRHPPPAIYQRACDAIVARGGAKVAMWIGDDGGRAVAGKPVLLQRADARATVAASYGRCHLAEHLDVRAPFALHLEPIRGRGFLAVVFHEAVRAEPLRQLVRACARAIEDEIGAMSWFPPRGGTPPTGAPAAVAAGVAWPTWKPPKSSVPSWRNS